MCRTPSTFSAPEVRWHPARTRGLAALGLALLLAAGAPGAGGAAEPIVIWLSLDGVRHDALDRAEFPALARMAREGARAAALVPIFPSSTFPNHVAQVTGTHADRHGIVANRFLDSELGEFDYGNDARFLQAEPLWVAAERQGLRTATFFWVGSETDWHGIGASLRRAPFESRIGEAEKVEQLLAWLDLPEPLRPRLLLSWWHGADHAGHLHGPGSPEVREALRLQDRLLGRLLAGLDRRGLWERTTLLVTSDHGMTRAGVTVDARVPLRRAGVRARVIQGSAFAHVHLRDPSRVAAAIAAYEGIEGVRAFPAGLVPAELRYRHPTRTGQVVVLAQPPVRLRPLRGGGIELLRRLAGRRVAGVHGYDPARHPEMHGILLALGRGVPQGAQLGRVRAIDLAATVASLLGIEPPRQCEGKAIPALHPLRQVRRPRRQAAPALRRASARPDAGPAR